MTGQEKERGLSWRNVLRTTAALLAGTLLVTGGVAAGANAQERVIWREGGGLVVPNSDSLSGVTDTGVATYVGRDMHVGMISSEAEGTTIVGGRLQFDDLRHNGGNAWHGAEFRRELIDLWPRLGKDVTDPVIDAVPHLDDLHRDFYRATLDARRQYVLKPAYELALKEQRDVGLDHDEAVHRPKVLPMQSHHSKRCAL